jgi:hypothetical protein
MSQAAFTVYSFLDLSLAIVDPDVGSYSPTAGELGFGQLTIEMITDRITHRIAADGLVMIGYKPGSNANVDITVQQTSPFHNWLLNWANTKFGNADSRNVFTLAGMQFTARNILDGTQHVCMGVTPTKIPPKAYGAEPADITWRLIAANATQVNVSAPFSVALGV